MDLLQHSLQSWCVAVDDVQRPVQVYFGFGSCNDVLVSVCERLRRLQGNAAVLGDVKGVREVVRG